jgi:transposase
MRMFLFDKVSAREVAARFGYTTSTVFTLARNLKDSLKKSEPGEDPYFKTPKMGRKIIARTEDLAERICELRRKGLSVPDIKVILDATDLHVSEGTITRILKDNGFFRLARRDAQTREDVHIFAEGDNNLVAPIARHLSSAELNSDYFSSKALGILSFLPIIKAYGIDTAIENSDYPANGIGKLPAILSFLALKLSSIARYGSDDEWCMDRGMGLFAGLNVLPKTAWFSSYSSAVSQEMNVAFLKSLHTIWSDNGLLSDTVNMDFTAIPYWGDEDPFENNWSGKRGKALPSLQAVLAQDPQNGILCYGDATIKHDNQDEVVLEFLDFYSSDPKANGKLKYIVFDSKFTTYENLVKLHEKGILFLTIQRRSKSLEEYIDDIPESQWKTVRVERANNKGRYVTYAEEITTLKKCGETPIRRIFIKGNGKMKPAVLMTNDSVTKAEALIQKYAQRWLIETEIAEHIQFFHLNRNSSGIVIKVDFDLTMTILAHNLYRLLAMNLEGYSHCQATTIYSKFIENFGDAEITEDKIIVKLNRKRTLPLLLETMSKYTGHKFSWLDNHTIEFTSASHT